MHRTRYERVLPPRAQEQYRLIINSLLLVDPVNIEGDLQNHTKSSEADGKQFDVFIAIHRLRCAPVFLHC